MSPLGDGVLRKDARVGWVTTSDGVYVTHPARSSPFSVAKLSSTGASVWDLLDEHARLPDLIEAVAAHWGIPTPEIRSDVTAFIESLVDKGILQRHDV